VEEGRFLNSKFLILKKNGACLHLISLNQVELHAAAIPLQADLDFFDCSADGSLIVQVGEGLHVFTLTALPSQRQIHFTNSFTCRLPDDEQLKQAANQSDLLYLLNRRGVLNILTVNAGELVAQFAGITAFLCFDDFVLVKLATWHLYWNMRLFDLEIGADAAIYPQLPGILAISSDCPSFSLSANSLNTTFLLPKLFHLTGQLRLLEKSRDFELVLEYLLLECLQEAELLRQFDEFFAGNLCFARAVIRCCRKVELSEATGIFAHFFNFTALKIIEMSTEADCMLFLPFLLNSDNEQASEAMLSKLTGSALKEAQKFIKVRAVSSQQI
jgi:hypothetical protein